MNAPLFSLTIAGTLFRITPLFLLGVAVALVLALNASLMLLAPTRHDVLPRWLRAPNSMIPGGHLQTRFASAEVRITGLLVLLMLTWVVYDMLTRPR